jgi:hypothetical protein
MQVFGGRAWVKDREREHQQQKHLQEVVASKAVQQGGEVGQRRSDRFATCCTGAWLPVKGRTHRSRAAAHAGRHVVA